MNRFKKYCLAPLLLCAYLSGCIGLFSALFLGLHKSSFQTLVINTPLTQQEKLFFSNKEFLKINWEEKDREFEWNNKMYDVSKITKTSEGYEIFCVNDSEEESLIGLFKEWKQTHPLSKIKTIFQPQFCNEILPTEKVLLENVFQRNEFIQLYFLVLNHTPSPPPELI